MMPTDLGCGRLGLPRVPSADLLSRVQIITTTPNLDAVFLGEEGGGQGFCGAQVLLKNLCAHLFGFIKDVCGIFPRFLSLTRTVLRHGLSRLQCVLCSH